MIVEAVVHAGRHTNAVNVVTVYRTLDLLVELGLVSRADLWDGRVTYASPDHGPHCHLVCRHYGHVIEADYELVAPLDECFRKQYQFVADLDHLAIPGLCADCEARLSQNADKD
jgi:Fur family ferric uptake transcriptional regulator